MTGQHERAEITKQTENFWSFSVCFRYFRPFMLTRHPLCFHLSVTTVKCGATNGSLFSYFKKFLAIAHHSGRLDHIGFIEKEHGFFRSTWIDL